MLQFTVIGYLGGDATIKVHEGRQFVSFNVSHNDSYTDSAGILHESTQWVSCALNGDGGKLLQHLRKGRLVYVQGRGSCRTYSSPKLRQMVAGLNITVDRIELLGSGERLVKAVRNGDCVYNAYSASYISEQDAAILQVGTIVEGDNNKVYEVRENGFLYEVPSEANTADNA